MTAATLFDYLINVVRNAGSEEAKWQAIDNAVRKIAAAHPWHFLRRSVSITQATGATSGYLMPPTMVNVIEPMIDSDDYVYERIDPAMAHKYLLPSNEKRYFFLDDAEVSALASTGTVSIDKGSTTLTFSATLPTATYAGQYIQLFDQEGHDVGQHLLSTASGTSGTLAATYYGPRINAGTFRIRPATCKRLSFIDDEATRVAVTVTAHYWVYPQRIFQWTPATEFPDAWLEPLKLAAWIECQTDTVDAKGETVRTMRRKEYDMELAKAWAIDPHPTMQNIARDRRGNVRRMGWR